MSKITKLETKFVDTVLLPFLDKKGIEIDVDGIGNASKQDLPLTTELTASKIVSVLRSAQNSIDDENFAVKYSVYEDGKHNYPMLIVHDAEDEEAEGRSIELTFFVDDNNVELQLIDEPVEDTATDVDEEEFDEVESSVDEDDEEDAAEEEEEEEEEEVEVEVKPTRGKKAPVKEEKKSTRTRRKAEPEEEEVEAEDAEEGAPVYPEITLRQVRGALKKHGIILPREEEDGVYDLEIDDYDGKSFRATFVKVMEGLDAVYLGKNDEGADAFAHSNGIYAADCKKSKNVWHARFYDMDMDTTEDAEDTEDSADDLVNTIAEMKKELELLAKSHAKAVKVLKAVTEQINGLIKDFE